MLISANIFAAADLLKARVRSNPRVTARRIMCKDELPARAAGAFDVKGQKGRMPAVGLGTVGLGYEHVRAAEGA